MIAKLLLAALLLAGCAPPESETMRRYQEGRERGAALRTKAAPLVAKLCAMSPAQRDEYARQVVASRRHVPGAADTSYVEERVAIRELTADCPRAP